MDLEFWQGRWDEGRIGFHQTEINPYLQRCWGRLGVSPGDTVFVPLCGKSKDMLWLRAQGYAVVGVEIVPRAVQAFFAENGLTAKTRRQGHFTLWEGEGIGLFCGDFFDLTAHDMVDVTGVYDRVSLIALPPALRKRYAEHLRAILPDGANILLVTMDYPQAEMEGPPFAVTEQEVETLYKDYFRIEPVCTEHILAVNPRFQEQGLSRLQERVYLLTPR